MKTKNGDGLRAVSMADHPSSFDVDSNRLGESVQAVKQAQGRVESIEPLRGGYRLRLYWPGPKPAEQVEFPAPLIGGNG